MLAAASLIHCGGPQTTSSAPPAPPEPAAPPAAPEPAPAATSAAAASKPALITKSAFGTVDGKEVNLYVLTNANGLVMKVTNYGTIITEFHVPDRTGKLGDIVAGYDNLDGYIKKTPYFGATIGRCANRIINGAFCLETQKFPNSINVPAWKDEVILKPGQTYKHAMIHRFSTECTSLA